MDVSSEKPLEVFFCYAQQNEDMRNQLEKHLRIMQRQKLIIAWHESKVNAGREWEREANDHLNTAQIILWWSQKSRQFFVGNKTKHDHSRKHVVSARSVCAHQHPA